MENKGDIYMLCVCLLVWGKQERGRENTLQHGQKGALMERVLCMSYPFKA